MAPPADHPASVPVPCACVVQLGGDMAVEQGPLAGRQVVSLAALDDTQKCRDAPPPKEGPFIRRTPCRYMPTRHSSKPHNVSPR
jgi:hypothetical protein